MSLSVSVLATGAELLDGRVVDTNSNYVARELAQRGLILKRVLCVGDDIAELSCGLGELAGVSDIILTSGGLGPTQDDLTREAVAAFAKVGLAEDPDARVHLESFYEKRGRVVDETNLKQALLPVGSVMVGNPNGTAPGFIVSLPTGVSIAALSGVPREFKAMFDESVLPYIVARAGTLPRVERIALRTFGMPESAVGKFVANIGLDSRIEVGYRAAFPEVHVVLKTTLGRTPLEDGAAKVRQALGGGVIFSEDAEESLEKLVHKLLIERGATVAVAESCTGGLLSGLLTSQPGACEYYRGGVVAYDNSVKEALLGVSSAMLRDAGAVSEEVVCQMADSVRAKFGCSFSLAVSGIAGPAGGTPEKPVGTFFVGLASEKATLSRRCFYVSSREYIRKYAAVVAIDLLRRTLQEVELPSSYPIVDQGKV